MDDAIAAVASSGFGIQRAEPGHSPQRRRAPLLFASLALVACSERPEGPPIPLTRSGLIQTVVSGVPLHLVLDTGATDTIVRREAVASLEGDMKEWPRGAAAFHDSRGSVQEIDACLPNAAVALGSAQVVVPALALFPRQGQRAVEVARFLPTRDGLLGMDVLRSVVLWVDFPKQQLRVLSPTQLDASLKRAGRDVVHRVSLSGTAREPRIRVQLEGSKEVELLMDTGAEHTSLPLGTAAELGLPPGKHLVHDESLDLASPNGTVVGKYTAPAWDGSSQGWLGVSSGPKPLLHLRSIAVGPHEVRDLPVTESDRVAVLGRDFLGRFDWVWHGPRGELWLLSPRR